MKGTITNTSPTKTENELLYHVNSQKSKIMFTDALSKVYPVSLLFKNMLQNAIEHLVRIFAIVSQDHFIFDILNLLQHVLFFNRTSSFVLDIRQTY